MDHKQRLTEIAEFLQPYQRIWQNEIMLMYPDPMVDFPTEWIEELISIQSKEDNIRLEKKDVSGLVQNHELLKYYQRIEELCKLDSIPELPPLQATPFTFLHMIPKKQHEIERLAPYINYFHKTHNLDGVIDIGGGIGLLAQTLNKHYELKVCSLDMDSALQATGSHRYPSVKYLNVKVNAEEEAFLNLIQPDKMTVGLHTCGILSIDQLKASSKSQAGGIINLGCCYHRLHKYAGSQNISSFARKLPFKVEQSLFALTLASRAHRKMNDKDYEFKLKVKTYRYALHFLLHDEYGHRELITLGNSSPKLYDQSFGIYALEQLDRIKIVPKQTKEELDSYIKSARVVNLIKKMLAAGLIRNALGRPLELYLLHDRAIYLEEQGYSAELIHFFDEPISPRNIGIVARLA